MEHLPHPLRILIATKDSFTQDYLTRLIQRQQIDVLISGYTDGVATLEALFSDPFDLLLLDLEVPILGGIEILELMRSNPETKNLQVFVLTGLSNEASVRKAVSLGVTDYLLKPYHSSVVEARLAAAVERVRTSLANAVERADTESVLVVVDRDSNFCETVKAAIPSTEARVHTVRAVGAMLSEVLRRHPKQLWVNPQMISTPVFLSTIARVRPETKIFALIERNGSTHVGPEYEGVIEKSFVPEKILAALRNTSAAEDSFAFDPEAWWSTCEEEAVSAVQQTFGIMTGREVSLLPPQTEVPVEIGAHVRLRHEDTLRILKVQIAAGRPASYGMAAAMLGIEAEEMLDGDAGNAICELCNIVAGRIKARNETEGEVWTQGIPELIGQGKGRGDLNPLFERSLVFEWQEDEPFEVAFVGALAKDSGGSR